MKQLFILVAMLFTSVFSNAQLIQGTQPERFTGVLFDKSNNQRLEAAMITVEMGSTPLIVMTDAEGRFSLVGIPKDVFTIKISISGYREKVISNVHKLEDVEFHIGLEPLKLTGNEFQSVVK